MKNDSPRGSENSCYKESTDRKMVDKMGEINPSSSDKQKNVSQSQENDELQGSMQD